MAAIAIALAVGCGRAPMATSSFRLQHAGDPEPTCLDRGNCGGTGEALPATLIGLGLLLGFSVVHEALRGS